MNYLDHSKRLVEAHIEARKGNCLDWTLIQPKHAHIIDAVHQASLMHRMVELGDADILDYYNLVGDVVIALHRQDKVNKHLMAQHKQRMAA